MGKLEKHTSYILLTGTFVLFGIGIYLLLSGGESHGVTSSRYGVMKQGAVDGESVLVIACILLVLFFWMRRGRSKGFTLSCGAVNRLIANDTDVEQVLEYLTSIDNPNDVCLSVENRNNKHVLQIKSDGAQEFFIYLCDKKNRRYLLTNPKRTVCKPMGFTLKQASGVVDDYFRTKNLLKDDRYVWVADGETEHSKWNET